MSSVGKEGQGRGGGSVLTVIAAGQAVALALFVAAVAWAAVRAGDLGLAVGMELVVYGFFLAALAVIARGLARGRLAVLPGFLLAQVFGLAAARLLFGSDALLLRWAGAALALSCLTGLVLGGRLVAAAPRRGSA